jgi:hypothetical protein
LPAINKKAGSKARADEARRFTKMGKLADINLKKRKCHSSLKNQSTFCFGAEMAA